MIANKHMKNIHLLLLLGTCNQISERASIPVRIAYIKKTKTITCGMV